MTKNSWKLLFQQAPFCGCGTDEGKWGMLKTLLEIAEDRETPEVGFYYAYGDIPARAIEFMGHVLNNWGLTEHGGGIGHAWLTHDGRQLLEWLREWGIDADTWPEWWSHAPACACSNCRED